MRANVAPTLMRLTPASASSATLKPALERFTFNRAHTIKRRSSATQANAQLAADYGVRRNQSVSGLSDSIQTRNALGGETHRVTPHVLHAAGDGEVVGAECDRARHRGDGRP